MVYLKGMYDAFGFRGNVFNTDSLGLNAQSLDRFVGRVQELKAFVIAVSADRGARVVVSGDKGVGKTSFFNVAQYAMGFEPSFVKQRIQLHLPVLVPCYGALQLADDDGVERVLAKAVSNVVFSAQRFAEAKKLNLSPELKKYIKWISDAVVVSHSAQVGAAGLAVGGGRYEQHKSIADQSTTTLRHRLNEVINLICQNLGVDGVFLTINNIELLNEQKLCRLFDELRDYLFNFDKLWLVLSGQMGLYSSLYQQAPRVAEVISGQEVKLAPLSEEEVVSVLNMRCRLLANSKSTPLPIELDLVRDIYKHSDGEIRQVLKSCNDIMQLSFQSNPNMKFVKADWGQSLLRQILFKQLGIEQMKSKEREFMRVVLEKAFLRPKDFKLLKLKSAAEFINKAKPLVERNFLKKDVLGNVAKYKATGRIHLASHLGIQF